MSSAREIQAILAALSDRPSALATLIAVKGSSYRQPGARCLVLDTGVTVGSISGGCLEEDVRLRASKVLASGEPQVAIYDTATENDLVWGTGLGCGGEIKVFFERLSTPAPDWIARLRENFQHRRDTLLRVVYASSDPRSLGTRLREEKPAPTDVEAFDEYVPAPPSVVVFGAGDDAMPLVQFACQLGWHATVLDSRAAYATRVRFPQAHEVVAVAADIAADHPAIDERSHVIVMSHRYRDDAAFLRSIRTRPLAYLGVLGPRQRTQRIMAELSSDGVSFTAHTRERTYAPVGLDLGGAAPETVALSIIAELQAIQSKRVPRHLRDSSLPIHG